MGVNNGSTIVLLFLFADMHYSISKITPLRTHYIPVARRGRHETNKK